MARIVITGASGFVGGATVAAAHKAGHSVVALTRRSAVDGTNLNGKAHHALDLAAPGAAEELLPILEGADAVIHAAGAMAGDDAVYDRDSLLPTRALLAALGTIGTPPRLVLVSSFSVYGFASLPEGALLNELTPLEAEPQKRDAYTRAKLAQEELAICAAQNGRIDLWLIRPGAIYGPGRLDTARLGISFRSLRLSPGGDPTIPALDVARVGEGLVAAATVSKPHDRDVSAPGRHPAVVINLTDTDMPRQSVWAAAVGIKVTSLPRAAVFKTAAALDLAGDLVPGLSTRVPTALLPPRLAAAFRNLRYSTHRAEDFLGLSPGPASAERLAKYAERGRK